MFFLLFLDKKNMQFVLKNIFDDRLGVPLPDKSYADDCRVFTPENPTSYFYNIVNSVDMFVAAHFFGWTVKTWIFRNSVIAWSSSIVFEIFEWTMEVWLDNFAECWWDHIILDLFGCNMIGMFIGIWTMKYFEMRPYHWFFEPTPEYRALGTLGKIKYFFTSREEHVRKGKWHWLSSYWSLTSVVWFVFGVCSLLDLSYFYNKANLEIPTSHWLFSIRILVVATLSIISASEYYDYVTKRKLNSMGVNVFMVHLLIILESALWLKHLDYDRIFKRDVYFHMKVVWMLMFIFLGLCYVYIAIDSYCKSGKSLKKRKTSSIVKDNDSDKRVPLVKPKEE